MISIKQMTNANVYLNGTDTLGQVQEIDIADLKFKMADHKAIGLFGTLEFPTGVDKLSGSINWASFYDNSMKLMADPFTMKKLQIRGSLETYESTGRTAQVPVVVYVSATSANFPIGMFKQHDNVELKSDLTIYYLKVTIDGQDIMEFDPINNIYKTAGNDVLAQYRANLGI